MITMENYLEMMTSGEGEATEAQKNLAQKIFEAVEEDVKGLKAVNVQLKEEKKKEKDKHQEELNKLTEENKKLQEEIGLVKDQVKNNSPEEARKYYEQQLSVFENNMKAQLADRDRRIAEYQNTVKEYEHKDMLRSQEVEFERLIRKTNADPATYDTVKTMVLGNGDRFSSVKTADGDVFLSTNGSGKSIGNSIDEFLSSPTGKRLCNNNSSGAGAEGGYRPQTAVKNPFKSETWNETEQMKLYRENPQLAKQLEAAAGRA